MFVVRLTRWTIMTYQSNEFDAEVEFQGPGYAEMLAKCKFCQIIANGETLCYQDEHVVAFKDIKPVAQQHFLVCPKRHIKNVNALTPAHGPLLKHMHKVANQLLGEVPAAKVGFHRVLSTSVDHLHMHAFELPFKSCYIANRKYHRGYFLDIQKIYDRL